MSVCCECCVLSNRGLCDELITHPEESYRLWCVVVCDLETSWMRRPWPTGGCRAKNRQTYQFSLSNFTPISLHMVECSWIHTVSCLLMYCSFVNIGHADMMCSTVSSNCLQSIIIVITFIEGIYNYIPETNHVSRVYSVTAVLYLKFVLHVMLFHLWNMFCTFTLGAWDSVVVKALRY